MTPTNLIDCYPVQLQITGISYIDLLDYLLRIDAIFFLASARGDYHDLRLDLPSAIAAKMRFHDEAQYCEVREVAR